MDARRFDDLTRAIATSTSRRRLFQGLVGGALGALGLGALGSAIPAGPVLGQTCAALGEDCDPTGSPCCSGTCTQPIDSGVPWKCEEASPCAAAGAFCGSSANGLPCCSGPCNPPIDNPGNWHCPGHPPCPDEQLWCGNGCIPYTQIETDPNNCGGCGQTCAAGWPCQHARCVFPPNLRIAGIWVGAPGTPTLYLTQDGATVWGLGLSHDGLQPGLTVAYVLQGEVNVPNQTLDGSWADVPSAGTLNSGQLSLALFADTNGAIIGLRTTSASGGFGGGSWQLFTGLSPEQRGIQDVFDTVVKNHDSGGCPRRKLLDNLKPYKDHAVAFATVRTAQEGVQVGYPINHGLSYHDFACLPGDQDGDVNFNVQVNDPRNAEQLGFWSDGWEPNHDPNAIRDKLDYRNRGYLHLEAMMYGGTTTCSQPERPPLLPGWADSGGNSVLLDGRPIQRRVVFDKQGAVSSIGGVVLGEGTKVRVTGVLVLDCGHYTAAGGCFPCDDDEPDTQNQEMHPVYAIDVINPTPSDDVTGVWAGSDQRTYYVRQVGDAIWWLGMGPFRDQTWAQVFHGTIQNGTITGTTNVVSLESPPAVITHYYWPLTGQLTLTLWGDKVTLQRRDQYWWKLRNP